MRSERKIHLICNAHLDPVWMWHRDEGLAETLATFRTATQICREYKGFVFNHNESLLYQWIEEHDPELFQEIKALVKEKYWHIMGGWFIQPDCNMPSGESFVRQILVGKNYFKEKFGVTPTTAINFDPFGHTRGLVQILAKAGYDSYLVGRPWQEFCALPSKDFIWVGYDGSEIMAHRFANDPDEMYNTMLGQARAKIEAWLKRYPKIELGLILWGIGNHGGGPSRCDLNEISKLMIDTKQWDIVHSTPEQYFADLHESFDGLPRWEKALNPWATGCYTSMVKIKQMHRRLENEYFTTEKMATTAFVQGLTAYPDKELNEALYDLLFGQFHDILPGSGTQEVEWACQRMLSHGLEILSQLKSRIFFVLTSGQEKAREGEIPILVYNPHSIKIRQLIECEFALPDMDFSGAFRQIKINHGSNPIPCQVEQEMGNCRMVDWRKRVVFEAELEPGQITRFDCQAEKLLSKPEYQLAPKNGKILFHNDDMECEINCETGLIDRYQVAGRNSLCPNAFELLVIEDNEDSWEQYALRYNKVKGRFRLMTSEKGSGFSGLHRTVIPSVRVIEDGQVRSVVESVFVYGDSFVCQRYKLPKKGSEIEVDIRVYWNEKDCMLKLSIPVKWQNNRYIGQVAYGREEFPTNGNEVVAQKWTAVLCKKEDWVLTCINEGCYASDCSNSGLRLTLLRSPAFACGPVKNGEMIAQDRFSPRVDQGENHFHFWFNMGPIAERLERIDCEALAKNEQPYALSFFSSGKGNKPQSLAVTSDEAIQISALKRAAKNDDLIIRLFEPTGVKRQTILKLLPLKINVPLVLTPFEIKTLRIDMVNLRVWETDLIENKLREVDFFRF